MELADGRAVVHGVEGGDLVDAHGGHLEQAGDLVHDTDAGEAVLALAEVEDGHDGGLLVLRRVPLQDLRHHLLVGCIELERDVWVVVARVPVLLWEGKGGGGVYPPVRWVSWDACFRFGGQGQDIGWLLKN